MQPGQGHLGQLGHPSPNEVPVRVLVQGLLGGRIDAQGVDARGAALHLHLAPVDARFEVGELPRQVQAGGAPMQPQVVGRKAHQHGPHAEIQPAGGVEAAHAGVHHGVARLPVLPGLQPAGLRVAPSRRTRKVLPRTQAVAGAGEVGEFDFGL